MTSGSSFFPVENPQGNNLTFSQSFYPNSWRGNYRMDVGYEGPFIYLCSIFRY